jgi:hypothetical protein
MKYVTFLRNKPDNFCYIFQGLTVKAQRKPLSPLVRKAYEIYFGCKVGDTDKVWAPKICCGSCLWTSTGWLKGTHRSMPFAVPMVWRKQRNHLDDCCLCITNITGFSVQSKHTIDYPNIPSALTLVPHDDSMPVPEPPKKYTLNSEPNIGEGFTRSWDKYEGRPRFFSGQ